MIKRVFVALLTGLLAGCLPLTILPVTTSTPAPVTTTMVPATPDTPTPEVVTPTEPPTQEPTPFVTVVPIPTLPIGDPLTITAITMLDPEHGWAVGSSGNATDHILRTADGARSFWEVTPPESTGTGVGAHAFFLNDQHAWVTYAPFDLIWRTADGGSSWQAATVPFQGMSVMYFFSDPEHGWVMKFLEGGMNHVYSVLLATTDGGLSWQTVFDPYTENSPQSFSKSGMAFYGTTAWITRTPYGVQPGAFVDVSPDGGLTWNEIPLPPPDDSPNLFNDNFCNMYSPLLYSQEEGGLIVTCTNWVNNVQTDFSFLFKTSDGGVSWQRFSYPGGDLVRIDQNVLYAVGRTIHVSLDGGQNWGEVRSVNWDGTFSFINRDQGWAVARNDQEVALVQTMDGCSSFDILQPVVIAHP